MTSKQHADFSPFSSNRKYEKQGKFMSQMEAAIYKLLPYVLRRLKRHKTKGRFHYKNKRIHLRKGNHQYKTSIVTENASHQCRQKISTNEKKSIDNTHISLGIGCEKKKKKGDQNNLR